MPIVDYALFFGNLYTLTVVKCICILYFILESVCFFKYRLKFSVFLLL